LKKNGFSLVELLVLPAVIAALIVFISIAGNTIQRAKATRIAKTMDTISLLAEEKLLREGPFFFSNLSDDLICPQK
jgi:Tfp pilus assembly protein PilE